MEPLVVLLARLGKDKWAKSHVRNMHTNDILCLETCGKRLFSAGRDFLAESYVYLSNCPNPNLYFVALFTGFDSDLIVSSFPPKIVTKYPVLQAFAELELCKGESRNLLVVPKFDGVTINHLPSENFESVSAI